METAKVNLIVNAAIQKLPHCMKAVSDRGVSGREDVAGMAYRFNERIELNKSSSNASPSRREDVPKALPLVRVSVSEREEKVSLQVKFLCGMVFG